MLDENQLNRLDEVFKHGEILNGDAAVEVTEGDHPTITITFAVKSDWSLSSIRFIYEGEVDTANILCLLWELADWSTKPKAQRYPISDLISQYRGHLTDPKVYIKDHVQ